MRMGNAHVACGRETIAGKIMRELWNERWSGQARHGPGKRTITWRCTVLSTSFLHLLPIYIAVVQDAMRLGKRTIAWRQCAVLQD